MNYEYLRTYALRHFIRRIKQAYRAWLLIAMLMMPVLVESQEPGDGCYYITSVCNQGQFQYEFNPGPINISVDYSYMTPQGILSDHIERTSFLNEEYSWVVCFNELAGKNITSITFCTINSAYEICNPCFDLGDLESQLYKELPWEMQIAGHNYKAWQYGMYADICTWDANPNLNTVTPLPPSEQTYNKKDNTPRFIDCQDKIPLEMFDGYNNKWFKLNSTHQSNICLQLSVHEWTGPDPVQIGIHYPYNNYGEMLTYDIISNYSPGDQIDLASLFRNIRETGKKFVLAIAVTCCSNQFTPLSNIQSGDDRKRFFAFEYYESVEWTGEVKDGMTGTSIEYDWDNSFPGPMLYHSGVVSSFQYLQYVSANSESKMQIFELQNCSLISPQLLYETSYFPTMYFLDHYNPVNWAYYEPSLNDPSKCFELRVVTKDACGIKNRSFYFHRGTQIWGPPVVEEFPDLSEPGLRNNRSDLNFVLKGNPSTVFRYTIDYEIKPQNNVKNSLLIMNIYGDIIYEKSNTPKSGTIKSSNLWNPGVYFYIFKIGDIIKNGKWVKM